MSGSGAWQVSLMYWLLTQFSVYVLYILHSGLSAVPQKAQVLFTDFSTVYAHANDLKQQCLFSGYKNNLHVIVILDYNLVFSKKNGSK